MLKIACKVVTTNNLCSANNTYSPPNSSLLKLPKYHRKTKNKPRMRDEIGDGDWLDLLLEHTVTGEKIGLDPVHS